MKHIIVDIISDYRANPIRLIDNAVEEDTDYCESIEKVSAAHLKSRLQ